MIRKVQKRQEKLFIKSRKRFLQIIPFKTNVILNQLHAFFFGSSNWAGQETRLENFGINKCKTELWKSNTYYEALGLSLLVNLWSNLDKQTHIWSGILLLEWVIIAEITSKENFWNSGLTAKRMNIAAHTSGANFIAYRKDFNPLNTRTSIACSCRITKTTLSFFFSFFGPIHRGTMPSGYSFFWGGGVCFFTALEDK